MFAQGHSARKFRQQRQNLETLSASRAAPAAFGWTYSLQGSSNLKTQLVLTIEGCESSLASLARPKWNDDSRLITIEGRGFSLVLDRATGDFAAANPRHNAPIATFPS